MVERLKPMLSLDTSVGTGVIISYPSGVVYTAQAAGTACLHPKLEGVYVPFDNDYLVEGRRFVGLEVDLTNYFTGPKYCGDGACSGLDKDDAAAVNRLLEERHVLDWIEVDMDRLPESREAWIFVLVKRDDFIASGFSGYPLSGVLTWSNSD